MNRTVTRSMLVAIAGMVIFSIVLSPKGADADVANYGAVLLDPFNPVPEIQFRPEGCGDACGRRLAHRHRSCDDSCQAASDAPSTVVNEVPCIDHCHISEHWERDWSNGGRTGQEWYDSGYRERDSENGQLPESWKKRAADYDDDDVAAPVAPAASTPAASAH
jgi:hypothetical protein